MAWQLINNHRAWELGPVKIASLRREEAAARAMGNTAGANILKARHEAAQVRWDAFKALHEPAPSKEYSGKRDLTKIDTQGL